VLACEVSGVGQGLPGFNGVGDGVGVLAAGVLVACLVGACVGDGMGVGGSGVGVNVGLGVEVGVGEGVGVGVGVGVGALVCVVESVGVIVAGVIETVGEMAVAVVEGETELHPTINEIIARASKKNSGRAFDNFPPQPKSLESYSLFEPQTGYHPLADFVKRWRAPGSHGIMPGCKTAKLKSF
jgi:hypothetical protein